ncbi:MULTISPECIES: flavin reductase family protein [unclassified Microbacterium]|uniref:flavin reductase family protein n=1 Tax=unclassified Microbacterium TaxID=2609290 RepID=UPI00214CC268|nr:MULTISPECIES: flavin reductase family protein [unclassified Microbacterium]MCR2783261.1 flavin reductase family protein [Microbacterium sp. zg.B96]WIM15864.1 flavin reductase family protein [Microbacterium sp. zg-B96]
MTRTAEDGVERTEWWKAVLGEYPTAVSLITALGPTGEPVGMIVGSFVAVSQDPPLIGFFGDDSSASFAKVVDADRFAVSVLGERQDDILRSFIRKEAERFEQPGLIRTAHGIPRLDDAVAWFEARTERVERFGDHRFVVGRVEKFGVGTRDAGDPLLYRRGGFGAFAIPADAVDARLVGDRLAAARAASDALTSVADRIGRDIAITTLVGESVVVLAIVPASVGVAGRDELEAKERRVRSIGVSLPFAAPIEPVFAAWAAQRDRSLWIERARHLVGAVDRRSVEAQLAAIRERGFGISVDRDLTDRFYSMLTDPAAERDSYAKVWSEYASRTIENITPGLAADDIAAVQVPVFDGAGEVVLVLTVSDLEPGSGGRSLDDLAQALVTAGRTLSAQLAVNAPAPDGALLAGA